MNWGASTQLTIQAGPHMITPRSVFWSSQFYCTTETGLSQGDSVMGLRHQHTIETNKEIEI